MNGRSRILVIEDDRDISRIIKDYIQKNGYEVHIANNAQEAWQSMADLNPDFIILDIMLPDADGIDLCRQIREKNNVPILILSARGSDTDKVLGLGFGADDYMTKPFSLTELLARVKSNLRRVESMGYAPQSGSVESKDIVRFGRITADRKGYKVSKDGKEIAVPVKEVELLFYLAQHPDQVFSKSQLLDAVWGYTSSGDESTITVYIRRLREKLEDDPSNPVHLKTVWGIGYKFSSDSKE